MRAVFEVCVGEVQRPSLSLGLTGGQLRPGAVRAESGSLTRNLKRLLPLLAGHKRYGVGPLPDESPLHEVGARVRESMIRAMERRC